MSGTRTKTCCGVRGGAKTFDGCVALLLGVVGGAVGCNAERVPGSEADGSGGISVGNATAGVESSSTTDAHATSVTKGDDPSRASTTAEPDEAEVCDGVDNDNDGIVDDVDEGGDGICDCIRIATLGAAGMWGDGDIFAQWLEMRASDGAHPLGDAVLTRDVLDPFQILVVQDVSVIGRTYDAAEVDALRGWVEDGGGLMTLIGYAPDPSERDNVNLLLAPFDLSYGEAQILKKMGGMTRPVTQWFDHPISDGITAVGVDNGYPVEGSGFVYAHEDGFDVGQAKEVGDGHVSVWGDEWITYDSEWQDAVDYQVERFWLNTIKWLTPMQECQVELPQIP